MLSIMPSSSAVGALRYFRENLAQADYYREDHIVGRWHGIVAKQLGLEGEINPRDFEALLFNVNPNTGERLTARNSKNRRAMYDFTYNAPKSVSLIYGITKDGDVLESHREAVAMAMQEVERAIQTQMGSSKGKHYVTTANGVWGEFVHDTSRPLQKQTDQGKIFVPDVHLHSHCTMINATWSNDQNRFRAIELGNVKGQAPYFEALYHSYLAENLKAKGFEIERSGKRWEVAGISRELIEKFSGRTLQIEQVAKERGIKSAQAKSQLGRLTRNDKNSSVADHELQEVWKERLTLTELHAIMNAKGKRPNKCDDSSKGNTDLQMNAEKALDLSLEHFLERNSSIQEKRVLAYAIDLASGVVPAHFIQRALSKRENIIRAEYRTVPFVTTKEMLQSEEQMIEKATTGKATKPAMNADYEIQNAILNKGQRAAVNHVLTSQDQIMMVSGDAGVGKTTLLQEIKQGIEASGKQLFAFAPSSDASRGVLRSKGFEGAETIAKLLNSPNLQEQLKNNVMLIDESGLVGVPTMNNLFDIANNQNARVILSGDYKQHSSVEAGDALKLLEIQSGLPVARVNEIVRQQKAEKHKEVIEKLARSIGIKKNADKRQSEVVKAYDQLDNNGNIIEVSERDKRQQLIATEYAKATLEKDNDTLVVAPTHFEGKEITNAIRNVLKQQGRIGLEDMSFTRLQSKHLTNAEKSLHQNYKKDDVIEFHQNVTGFKAGQKYIVKEISDKGEILVKNDLDQHISPLPSDKNEAYSLYQKEQIEIALGDKIRITKNIKSLAGAELFNGQMYDVRGFDQSGNVALSNGQILDKNAMHFKHGFVSTSHQSQGKDAKTVLIAQSSDSFGASNDKQFYTSISRASEHCKVFTDDKLALRQAISRSGDRVSATQISELSKTQNPSVSEVGKHQYMNRVREFYETKVKPSFEHLKSTYEQRSIEKEVGRGDFGLER
ncbi:conjugative relaxase [Dokdonia pacifica]|uniref:Conjugative relaxase domain-containing protein, TrwC/TraI family n=1 Tax=Dokdonia pacifica TaxID=1627892 RepID=A0A239AIL8_9FLAO|nr:MobF family relaxase [Dokdonia pacifica]GGG37342.1 conjugative relaxase [Dokdonia pacifica]SNR95211.1 conjugative relaxase domain-containing protein, TrwC/TraI family [Dokdonia pacifica]